jgi:two-component system sensor histidine kinase HydH
MAAGETTSENLLHRLARLSREAVGSGTSRELLTRYAEEAVAATGAARGFVALADFDAGGLVLVATAGEGWSDAARRDRLQDRDGPGTITSRVAATGRTLLLGDITRDAPDYRPYFPDIRSVMAVPIALALEERVRGVINLETPRVEAFGADDEAFVSALADRVALRLAHDDLYAREAALVQMGRELSAAPNLDALVQRVVAIADEILRFEDCSLFFRDPVTQRFVLAATRGGALASQVLTASYAPGEGLTGWVAEQGEPVRIRSLRDDPRWKGRYLEMEAGEIGAFLAVPIKSASAGVVGVLRVLRRETTSPWFPNDFTPADQEVLQTIASLVGTAVDNSRLTDRLLQSERMAAWGEMSAMSSHMIGNRVFAVKGDLNELEYVLGTGEPDETLSQVKRSHVSPLVIGIKQGLFRLEELLAEFRDFVRATALSPVALDANALVREVLNETFPKRCGVELQTDLTEDTLSLSADLQKLKRALSEIVENAISFQENGGMLQVVSRRIRPGDPLPTALAGLERAGGKATTDWAILTFADKGPGVPERDKERIFHPFVTTRARGMGLGLAIVKGIIEAHHGGIAEVGAPGEGARFLIALPLQES